MDLFQSNLKAWVTAFCWTSVCFNPLGFGCIFYLSCLVTHTQTASLFFSPPENLTPMGRRVWSQWPFLPTISLGRTRGRLSWTKSCVDSPHGRSPPPGSVRTTCTDTEDATPRWRRGEPRATVVLRHFQRTMLTWAALPLWHIHSIPACLRDLHHCVSQQLTGRHWDMREVSWAVHLHTTCLLFILLQSVVPSPSSPPSVSSYVCVAALVRRSVFCLLCRCRSIRMGTHSMFVLTFCHFKSHFSSYF